MKFALKVLLWKMSTAGYGTDPTPAAATDVLLAQDVDINPVQMETDSYAPVSEKFGEDEKIVGAVWCTMSFSFLLGGGGTPLGNASSVPNHDRVLRCAGWARVLNAGVSTVYSQIDTGEEDGAMYFYNDGVLYKMLGIRGSVELDFAAKRAPRGRFTGMGLRVPVVDATLPVPTLPNIPRPVAVNKNNTTITVDGYAARVSQFSVSQNNDVQYRNLCGREDVSIVNRTMSGKVTLEMPLVAEKDFLGTNGMCSTAAAVPITVVHGLTAGNIVTATMTKAQLFNPRPRNEQGILMLECDLHVVRNGLILTYT